MINITLKYYSRNKLKKHIYYFQLSLFNNEKSINITLRGYLQYFKQHRRWVLVKVYDGIHNHIEKHYFRQKRFNYNTIYESTIESIPNYVKRDAIRKLTKYIKFLYYRKQVT